MGSSNLFQDLIVIALDTQADPVKALAAQTPQKLLGHGVGVGFKGDLRRGRDIEVFTDGCEDGCHTVGTEKAGSAAAKIDGIHQIAGGLAACFPDMLTNGSAVILFQALFAACDGVKVAILAFAPAKGNVDINAQRFLILTGEKGHVCLLQDVPFTLYKGIHRGKVTPF